MPDPRCPRASWIPLAALATIVVAGAARPLPAQLAPNLQSSGPDVTVIYLTDISNNGVANGIRGYSIGTTSCNIGDSPVNWCNSIGGCGGGMAQNEHPVIAQNLYRLKDGRFTQIGMSWLKHGFLSTNSTDNACLSGISCISPPQGGDELGIGCTDTYGAGLNGGRPLGMRSEVDATTASFPYPYTQVTATGVDQWVQVDENDLDPAQNPGAFYFAEGQYVVDDDALAGNGLNNASYRRVLVTPGSYDLALTGATLRQQSALRAWQVADPSVEMTDADVHTTGSPVERFEVARKVTDLGGGNYHYEYAIHNLNSDRSAQRFAIQFANDSTVTDIGFKDIDHHSGEPYSNTDWTIHFDQATGVVSWETEDYATNHDANALRWGTLFNFWFDVDAPPNFIGDQVLTLFEPGMPCKVDVSFSPGFIFRDDFETGDTCAWSSLTP